MKNTLLLMAALWMVFMPVSIEAAPPLPGETRGYSGHFGDMDKNGDEVIDWNEFKAYFPHADPRVFEQADGDHNAAIDHDEWHEFKDTRGYGHDERREHRK